MMNIEFKEDQKFAPWWLWVILIGVSLLPLFGIYQQLILEKPFGDNPMSDTGLIVFAVFTLAMMGLFANMRLKTLIDRNGIQVRFIPFANRKVAWNDVKSAEVVDYGFVGGWGIRLWTSYGTVYNARGRIGLAVQLKNGKKFLIGTQKETELKHFLEKLKRSDVE